MRAKQLPQIRQAFRMNPLSFLWPYPRTKSSNSQVVDFINVDDDFEQNTSPFQRIVERCHDEHYQCVKAN